jgi:hypothetical protein
LRIDATPHSLQTPHFELRCISLIASIPSRNPKGGTLSVAGVNCPNKKSASCRKVFGHSFEVAHQSASFLEDAAVRLALGASIKENWHDRRNAGRAGKRLQASFEVRVGQNA